MKVTQSTIDFIKNLEGFRSKPYRDAGDLWTIGYGFTFHPRTKKPVRETDPEISRQEADVVLEGSLNMLSNAVRKEVKQQLSQNQYDALLSFAYNIGIGNFKKSELLREVNKDPQSPNIPFYFSNWYTIRKKPSQGLINRRSKEIQRYGSVKQGGKALLWEKGKNAIAPTTTDKDNLDLELDSSLWSEGYEFTGNTPEAEKDTAMWIMLGAVAITGIYLYQKTKKNGRKRTK